MVHSARGHHQPLAPAPHFGDVAAGQVDGSDPCALRTNFAEFSFPDLGCTSSRGKVKKAGFDASTQNVELAHGFAPRLRLRATCPFAILCRPCAFLRAHHVWKAFFKSGLLNISPPQYHVMRGFRTTLTCQWWHPVHPHHGEAHFGHYPSVLGAELKAFGCRFRRSHFGSRHKPFWFKLRGSSLCFCWG